MSGKLVMCGCHEVGAELIPHLIRGGLRFGYFVCLTPEQAARHGVSGYVDLRPLAAEYGIPVYVPETYALRAEADVAFFRDHCFDLLIQGGWQRLFPQEVLETLRIGAVGVHGSSDFLPKGRGRSPLNWSIIEGRRRFIAHLFLIKPGADDGDVFDWQDFDINVHDNIRTVYRKLSIVSRRMLLRSVPQLLCGEIQTVPQTGVPGYYQKRTPADGRIDWEETDVHQLHDFIRAQTRPYPGAFGLLDGATCRIWDAQVFDTRITYPEAAYGEVVERFSDSLVVNCRGGLLLVTDWEQMQEAGAPEATTL